MSDWSVLDLDGDPTPGDPDTVQAMAGRLRTQADLADHNTDRLRVIAGGGGGELRMEGDYAPLFTGALEELPGELSKLARAYRGCGDALSTYASSLAEVKTQAGNALRQGSTPTPSIRPRCARFRRCCRRTGRCGCCPGRS